MKKFIFSIAFAFAVISFMSCGNSTNSATSNVDTIDTVSVDTVDSAAVCAL